MPAVLTWTGSSVELLGLVIALYGYRRTWRDLEAEERFLAPLSAGFRRAWSATRRLLGFGVPQRRATVTGGIAAFEMGARLRAYGYSPPTRLPDPTIDLSGFALALQQNLDALAKRTHEAEARLSKRADATDDEIAAVEGRLTQQVRQVTRQIEQGRQADLSRTARGLREQVLGWAFIATGLVMQSVAQM